MSEGDDATQPDTRIHTDPVPRQSVGDLGERYEVGPVLGRGGMGEVRLARDLRIDREVAVKLLRSQVKDEHTLGRFFREARVQGVLEHPAVVPVHDMGIDGDGNPYFVMKRLAGTTLADVLAGKAGDRFPRRTLLMRLLDICLAIDFAHTRGVIHRDLKPANIMLGDYGEAYVLDWGLARIAADGESFREVASLSGDDGHTLAGELLGTPGYMSPEQARGDEVDQRTDVFALGTVLYEILAGKPALPRGMAAIAATLAADFHRPGGDAPPELDDLCARATATDVALRPTARAFADALQAYLDGDRDLARRTQLADEAVAAARTAADAGDRSVAMREAGRALALEPAHTGAQDLLARLLFDLPKTMPPEAEAAADAERAEVRQRIIAKSIFVYLAAIPLFAIMFALPTRHLWPVGFGIVSSAITANMAYFLSRKPLPMTTPWYIVFAFANSLTIATTGLLFGSLLILPMFVIGSLATLLSMPTRATVWVLVAITLLPFAVLLGCELTGVLPLSFEITGGHLEVTPYALDLTPLTVILVMGISIVTQVGATVDIQSSLRRATEAAQNATHTQGWHLRQLLPKGRSAPRSP